MRRAYNRAGGALSGVVAQRRQASRSRSSRRRRAFPPGSRCRSSAPFRWIRRSTRKACPRFRPPARTTSLLRCPNRRLVLKRNPNYHGSPPAPAEEIDYTIGVAPSRSVADVEAGRSDYIATASRPIRTQKRSSPLGTAPRAPPPATASSGTSSTPTLGWLPRAEHEPTAVLERALAEGRQLRDRPARARPAREPRLRTLPGHPDRSVPAARHARCEPQDALSPGGDLGTARRLAPDAHGTAVLYTCNLPFCRRNAQVIRSNLGRLGLNVDIREFPKDELFEKAGTKGEPFDILDSHWFADYADPSDFLNVLLDQRIRAARQPERLLLHRRRTRPEARAHSSPLRESPLPRLLGPIGRAPRDAAPWVAYAAGTERDFFSARIGCQIFQPVYGMDLAALLHETLKERTPLTRTHVRARHSVLGEATALPRERLNRGATRCRDEVRPTASRARTYARGMGDEACGRPPHHQRESTRRCRDEVRPTASRARTYARGMGDEACGRPPHHQRESTRDPINRWNHRSDASHCEFFNSPLT